LSKFQTLAKLFFLLSSIFRLPSSTFSEAIPAFHSNSSVTKLFFYSFFVASVGRPKKLRKTSLLPCGVSVSIWARGAVVSYQSQFSNNLVIL